MPIDTNRQTDSCTERQMEEGKDRQTDRQTGRQAEKSLFLLKGRGNQFK